MATPVQFNEKAIKFFDKLCATFPNEIKIRIYKEKFLAVKKINNKLPVEMFMENMKPFGQQIVSKDEEFFKQDQYVNHAESISGKMGLIEHWEALDQVAKTSIWDFIRDLYVLGMLVLGHQEELYSLMNS